MNCYVPKRLLSNIKRVSINSRLLQIISFLNVKFLFSIMAIIKLKRKYANE